MGSLMLQWFDASMVQSFKGSISCLHTSMDASKDELRASTRDVSIVSIVSSEMMQDLDAFDFFLQGFIRIRGGGGGFQC